MLRSLGGSVGRPSSRRQTSTRQHDSSPTRIPKNLQKVASPSNPILNTPSIAILNTWAEWAAGLGKLKLLLHTR